MPPPGATCSHPGACSRSVAFRSAKPRGRSSAPPGPMFCRPRHGSAAPGPQRQNPGACSHSVAFRSAKPRWPVIGPTGADVLACPAFALLKRGPPAKTPALAPVRSHFAPRNRAAGHRPHRGRCFGLPRFRFAQARSPGQNPGPPRFQSGFFCAKTGGRIPPLSDGGALTKSENIILCASSCHPPRSPYPHCTLPHVRFSGIGQKKKPQRKTAVPPYPICRTEKQSA